MRLFILSFLIAALAAVTAFAQSTASTDTYRVYDSKGNPSGVASIIKALDATDVVFLGEQHDDSVGHSLEFEIFQRAVADYLAKRRVALSLEMFELDVQIVVDEYLNGQITEAQFLASARPWSNYKADYRPLVELAKEKHLAVVAANAPRRYVNMVSRGGRQTLDGLTKEAKTWLAPLPYGEPSEPYAKKFKALMGPTPEAQMGIDNILASQSLWDATMANSIARYLNKNKGALVVHLVGGFHTESRLGTVEHLLRYRSKARVLVVTMRYEDDFKTFDPTRHAGIGDFVILTARTQTGQGLVSNIIRRMDTHSRALQSLRADLTMSRYDKQLNESDTLKGSVSYLAKTAKNPLYVRVDWTKPVDEQLALIDNNFELYRPRLNQVVQGQLSKGLAGGALDFINMSKDQLKANYSVVYLGDEQLSDGVKTWHLNVVPKTTTSYKTADIWVDGDGMPRQIKVNEQNGDSTTVLLSNIKKNLVLNEELFRLKYPTTVKKIKS